jgi:hypothetical protein
MDVSWPTIKEAFFGIGSIAGVIAFFRPLVETKLQRDVIRVERIKSMLNEQRLVDLEAWIYQHREVPCEIFDPFDQLVHERRTNQEVVRFTGPTSKFLSRELDALLASYDNLRAYIQVREWEPKIYEIEGAERRSWVFNKQAFEDRNGVTSGYVKHLDGAAEQAMHIRRAFQRFQLVAELHLFEVPFARWLLPKRFKTHDLE